MIKLLGVFFALCAVIALVAAAGDAIVDLLHERWPAVAATVERAHVVVEHATVRNGGGTWYRLEALVAAGRGRRRISSSSSRGAEAFEAWIERHPARSVVNVRLDPANPRNAELVDAEGLPMPRHPKDDLILFAIAAAAFAATRLPLARLPRRSPSSAP